MFSCQFPYLSRFSNADLAKIFLFQTALKTLLKTQALKKSGPPVNRFISVGDYKQSMQVTEHIVKKMGKNDTI